MPKINQLKPATSLANTDIMIADTSTGSDTRKIAYSDLRAQVQNESKSVFAMKGEIASDEQVADAVGDWLDTHVTPTGSAVAIDDTLKIQGAAADAKAAGEIIVINGTSGNGTRVNITTTDTDIELAEMSDVNELKSALNAQDGIINVTKQIPLESGYYTLSTAIAAVYDSMQEYATKGRIITFATALTGWETWQCRILDNSITEASWKNTVSWFKINKSTKQSIVIAAYDSSDEAKQNADFWTNSENNGIKLINDAIALLPTGGRIYLRSGTYKGAAGVAISVSNLLIEGESTNVIISRTTGSDVILTAGVENITLENLVFDTIAVPAGTNPPLYRNAIFGEVVRNNTGGVYDWVIAAYDSTPQAKRGADSICSDSNVSTIIANAIARFPNGGTIKFVAGTYNLTSVIDLNAKSNIALIGDGYNTKIVRASNPFRMNSATDHCVLQGINFSANGTFVSDNGNKMLNCWIGNRYVDLIPSNDGSVYVDPSLGIEGIRNAIYTFGVGQTGGKIILGIGTYENKSTTSPVDFYKSTSPTGYVSNVTIEGQGIRTVISRSTNINDVVANSNSISGCVLKNVNVTHNIQRTVGNPVKMLRLIGCYIGGKYVDESSEGAVNVVNVGKGRYFETISAAYSMFYQNSYPISETERWEIHIWGYVLETVPVGISKNRIDMIGHNALVELRGKGDVRISFIDEPGAYYGPGLEIEVRDIHFKKTGCYNYYQNYCVYVSSDNVRFYNCIFENASSSPTPFDQRNYAESIEATAGARRHGIGIECKKWGAQCKTEFHDCIGIGSPYGFMNTRGWYIVFGSPKLFNCVGYGGGIGEFCHGIINHRSSQAELVGCIGYASKTAFRKSAGIRFQAAGSSQLTGCKGYGSGGTKYISEGVSAARVTEICTALGIDPSAYVVSGVVQYAALTDAICAEINNDDITLTPLNANTEEGYGISFWANDGTAKLMNCEGYAGSGDRSHGLHIIAQAKPTINGGYFGIKDMLQNIAIVSNNGNDMVTPIGGELNDYSKYTVSRITVSIIGGLVSTDDLFYVESDESTPQTIVNGYNLKNVASIAIMPTIRTTIAAGKGIRIYIMRNGAKINIANGKYLMHIQYNYAGDDSSAVYIDNAADPLIVNAIIRADDNSDAVEIGSSYTGNAVKMYDCALHGNVDSGVAFAEKTAINNSSNYGI